MFLCSDSAIEGFGRLQYERVTAVPYNYRLIGHSRNACPISYIIPHKDGILYGSWTIPIGD